MNLQLMTTDINQELHARNLVGATLAARAHLLHTAARSLTHSKLVRATHCTSTIL